MRIAIVNDVKMVVEGLRRILLLSGIHEIAWVAYDGFQAVQLCRKDRPDLILMDLIMPVMDGAQATRRIMQNSPCPILVVTSSINNHSAQVFEAMGAGALDAVNTPEIGTSGGEDLLKKISILELLINAKSGCSKNSVETVTNGWHQFKQNAAPPLIVIGASSGGPQALLKILEELPKDFGSSILVVQHVDAQFANDLAKWLDSQCKIKVRLAVSGDEPMPGTVLIAGSEDHMVMTRDGKLDYTVDPVDEVYRPSVDVLFNSVARYWTSELTGVLLTGMGRDGANGLLKLREKGCHTIAQDSVSSAVYGMPKAAIEIGAAVDVLPIELIGPVLMKKRSNGIG